MIEERKHAIAIEYKGTGYCGWQRQKHCTGVQNEVERALSFVANHEIELSCAGRTDAGVHAVEQIAHFETSVVRNQRAWVLGCNTRLPKDIRIKWVEPVSHEFHARYSAIARSYRYIIYNSKTPSAIFSDCSSWDYRPLDVDKMREAAQCILGEHDFSAFRAAGCQAQTANRNIHSLALEKEGQWIYFDIKANAFLYHMVRNIVGSLCALGSDDRSIEWINELLIGKDRTKSAPTADAAGLYFVKAWYPEKFQLPHSNLQPRLS